MENFKETPPLHIHPSKLNPIPDLIPINDCRFPNLLGENFFALPYRKVETFDTDEKADNFFRMRFPRYPKGKSEWRCCGEFGRASGHRMRYSIRNCTCDNKSCLIQFKIQKCDSSGLIEIY